MVHDFSLLEVEKPAQSTEPWDYLKRFWTPPGGKVFAPLSEPTCALVQLPGQAA